MSRICVIGGSVAGLSAALMLARRGHRVTVLERDGRPAPVDPLEAGGWRRPTVPQTQQANAIPARGRQILRRRLPDVADALLEAGAAEHALAAALPTEALGRLDRRLTEDLVAITTRRGIIDAVLRQAASREPAISLHYGAVVDDLVWTPGSVPRALAVRTRTHDTFDADLVIDASGRRTSLPTWLRRAGVEAPRQSFDLEVVANTRFYRLRDPGRAPQPRFGYVTPVMLDRSAAYMFRADHDVVALVVARHPRDPDLAEVHRPEVFEHALRSLPPLAPYVDPDVASPISPVNVMGGLQGGFRRMVPGDRPLVAGLVPIGDALATTNPMFGRGLGLALIHAELVATSLDAQSAEPADPTFEIQRRLQATTEAIWQDCRELDLPRIDGWRSTLGLPVQRGRVSPPRLSQPAALRLALDDPDVYVRYFRAIQLLDPPADFFGDPGLVERADRWTSEQVAMAS